MSCRLFAACSQDRRSNSALEQTAGSRMRSPRLLTASVRGLSPLRHLVERAILTYGFLPRSVLV